MKINIAELLKDCPKGMELDCALFDNVILSRVDLDSDCDYPIRIETKGGCLMDLTKYGTYTNEEEAKCVIFPKGETTWEGFIPFVKGDIIYTDGFVAILFNITESGTLWYYCYYSISEDRCKIKTDFGIGNVKDKELRFATEEEKQKLFEAIKANGYKWNAENKTLEKLIEPKFKVGDRIKHKDANLYCTLGEYSEGISAYRTNIGLSLTHKDLEYWELVPNKFDINTLVPFESRVLVRDYDNQIWIPTFWGKRLEDDSNCSYLTTNGCYKYCIPYEGNQYLLGTTNHCDDFYKTWKK